MSFWLFFAILMAPIVIVGFMLFKYAVPSYFGAFEDQLYKHGSNLKKDMDELKLGSKDILIRLRKLEKKKVLADKFPEIHKE